MQPQHLKEHTKDLVRQATIAKRLGVAKQAIGNWIARAPAFRRNTEGPPIPFPPPALTIDGIAFWDWPTVRAWAVKSGKATP